MKIYKNKVSKLLTVLTATTATSIFITSIHVGAEPLRSAGLYYTASEIFEVSPLFKYDYSESHSGIYDTKVQSQSYAIKAEMGINDFLSVGTEIGYGLENENNEYRPTSSGQTVQPGLTTGGIYSPYYGYYNYLSSAYSGQSYTVRRKGMLSPKLYLNSHFAGDNFRFHGNLISVIKTEIKKEGSFTDDGNMSQGASHLTAQGAAEVAFGTFQFGGSIARDLWRGDEEVEKSIIPTSNQSVGTTTSTAIYSGTGSLPTSDFTFKGGYETAFKAFVETSMITYTKIGVAYNRTERDEKQSVADFSTQLIKYSSEEVDSGELYGRIRVSANSAVTASYINSTTNMMPAFTNQWQKYNSQSFLLSFGLKF